MLIDYHIHTKMCGHAEGEMEEYVREAVRKGLGEIGFNDHFPILHIEDTELALRLAMSIDEFPMYVKQVKKLQKEFKKHISIKLGCEIDYLPGNMVGIMNIINKYDFDYLYGSVHFLDDWMIDHPDHESRFKNKDLDKVYKDYFKLVREAAESKLFDCISHIDVIKKFGYKPDSDLTDIYEQTAKALERADMCIEVNTSGLYKPVGEIYPEEKFLKICYEHNVPVTLGSDSHKPEHVGRDFDKAVSLIKKIGYRKIVRFNKRQRSYVNV
ncbi:histidinol-phosphatase HisJ family protein [bacterium]|nr:histidinol-phosphatase HisJ family protein [bacterium]